MSLLPRYDVQTSPDSAAAFFGLPYGFLRLPDGQDEATITLLMDAAVEAGEAYAGRVFRKTAFTGHFPCFERDGASPRMRQGFVTLKRSPLVAVTGFEVDLAGEAAPTVLAPEIARHPGYSRVFVPKYFDGYLDPDVSHPIRVTFEAGYVNTAATFPDQLVSASVRLGLNQHVAYLYENRGDVAGDYADAMPDEVKRAYDTFRLIQGFA